MNITDLIGKRILAKAPSRGYNSGEQIAEFKILEVSPSGNWVKLMNLGGHRYWTAVTQVAFVEELKSIEPAPPKA